MLVQTAGNRNNLQINDTNKHYNVKKSEENKNNIQRNEPKKLLLTTQHEEDQSPKTNNELAHGQWEVQRRKGRRTNQSQKQQKKSTKSMDCR